VESQVVERVQVKAAEPGEQSVAKVYAVAYLGAAGETGSAGAVEELNAFIDSVLNKHPEFDSLLRGSSIGRDEKLQLIDRVGSKFGSERFVNFLRVLARHGRLDLLPSIRGQVELELERRQGQGRVEISSAVELSKESLASVRELMSKKLGCEPILETNVDPSLIGGVVIRVGDAVYDGSVKSQVKQLRARLRERCLNEIQRGRDRFSHPEGN